ncbi:hypothetical protein QTI33_28410 [Variovorax sp. J22P271]|uniref:hypothetical protein n=1 Tax=Variovorax davisae TaxID=3053515 RepID=UPI0025763CD6|nr:hypothetical protein [Variovorax sp. J22P271]MDM0036090.1 hypothetical protein [Variovorax sp. J22P271]
MNRKFGWTSVCAAALLLAACGGGGGNGFVPAAGAPASTTPSTGTGATPKVSVDDLATGSYVVSSGDASAPTVGKYYAAADGSRLLVFGDSDDRARQSYRREAGGAWVGVPTADKDVSVTLLQSNAVAAAGVELAQLAGHYRVQTSAGVMADFSVAADGAITAGSSACKLSGKLSPGVLPNTLKLGLAASTEACGGLPAAATGVLAVDTDYAPAKFRLLADNGSQLVDLWAYAD